MKHRNYPKVQGIIKYTNFIFLSYFFQLFPRIVASAFIAADVDQCNDALEGIFGRRHICDRESTFCLMSDTTESADTGATFGSRGKYTCVCRVGYYIPNESFQGFTSDKNDANVTNFR